MKLGLLWKSVLGEIEISTDPSIYATWFKKTKLLSHNQNEAVVGVPNTFTKKQLETRFKHIIKQALAKSDLSCKKLIYQVLASPTEKQNILNAYENNKAFNLNQGARLPWRQANPVGLNPKYSFDNFIPGSGNDLAYAAAQAVVSDLGRKYNPFFVYGGVGIGKTHLIQAIGNKILSENPSLSVVYRTVEQFVQEFTNAIRYKKIGDFTKHYRNTDVLIIDDIQFIANKEKTQEEFFHTFNVLHESGRQIIISSDKPPLIFPPFKKDCKADFKWGSWPTCKLLI